MKTKSKRAPSRRRKGKKVNKKPRPCLRCEALFISVSAINRICQQCKNNECYSLPDEYVYIE